MSLPADQSRIPMIVPVAPASSAGEHELEPQEKWESARRAHFISKPEFDPLHHRPHKTLFMLFLAFRATAIFQIWPTLVFFGGFSSMIVCLYLYLPNDAGRQIVVPTTMLTPLGLVLGLVLSYRTSSAYERYAEGRKLWAHITLGARTWARLVWIHCPDSLHPPDENGERVLSEADQVRAIVEKRTMVQMGLAFAVAVKHYLRGEEGILYEDLYDLVRFFPSLSLPSGLPSPSQANIGTGGQIRHRPSLYRDPSADYLSLPQTVYAKRSFSPESRPLSRKGSRVSIRAPNTPPPSGGTLCPPTSATSTVPPSVKTRRPLRPAQNPPEFRWSETFPFKYLVSRRQRLKAQGRNEMKRRMREFRVTRGVGQNVPLEVQLFMSTWIDRMEQRKTIDGTISSQLLGVVQSFGEALTDLERILTTPIPFSYNAHIVEVMWVYCIFLPFQLVDTFRWVTVPATLITVYTIMGLGAIGEEIENPFGYDKNDLDLDYFCDSIIRREIDAITARPFPAPEEWVFSAENVSVGGWADGRGADEYVEMDKEVVLDVLARKVYNPNLGRPGTLSRRGSSRSRRSRSRSRNRQGDSHNRTLSV